MQPGTESTFVVDLLTTLRLQRFSLRAWVDFFRRSWLMSCQTANDHPELKRSWRRVTYLVIWLALGVLICNGLLLGFADTLRLLPWFVFCVAWQQSDLFWHLGLNRSTQNDKLLLHIGVANTLTWLRALGASYLLARFVSGLTIASGLALVIFLAGILTDILDGQIARYTATQTKLGQVADAEADFSLYLALTIILLHNGVLPLWVGCVMLLRFIIPLVAVLFSYLAFAHPVHVSSTRLGKCAGLAQSLYFVLLLLPSFFFSFAHVLTTPLLIVTICLLVIAPIAQITTKAWKFGASSESG
jgi:phosphatidylglycerophosphate synthase